MKDYSIKLVNGWDAIFTHRGEFKMGCDYWDLILNGPQQNQIKYFNNKVVLVNDYDGKLANNCIQLSKEGDFGYLSDSNGGKWVIDFKTQRIAPHQWYIHHNNNGKYLAAYEQPAYKLTQEYIHINNQLIYITFPFATEEEINDLIDEYLSIRKKQLDKTYFKK